MWLLDANMDVHLVTLLSDLGISSDTADNRGWKALSNGELVKAACASGFVCLLTRDQLFGESASRALRVHTDFAVVLVGLPQQPWREYKSAFLAAWHVRPIEPVPGTLTRWP
jgi:hypothetical protein